MKRLYAPKQNMKCLCVANAESPPPSIIIPDELIREILLLLTVKSLVQFTCVCKSWKLIISDPQFAKLHLLRSSAKSAYLAHTMLLFKSHNQPRVSLCPVPLLFSSEKQKGDLNPMEINGFRLIGVCNGLVCMISELPSTEKISWTYWVRLWNPATRLWSQVPPLYLLKPLFPTFSSFGFGYDSLNDTYKVVVILDSHRECERTIVKVYNMGGSCWRSIQFSPALPHAPWQFRRPRRYGLYVSGTLNWVVIMNVHVLVIVSFDLSREVYSQLSLPYSCQQANDYRLLPILGVMKDSLCVLHNDGKHNFVIWQMKKFGAHGCWTQLFNFSFKEDLLKLIPSSFNPVGFVSSENDEVLLTSYHRVVLYNQRDNTFKFSRIPHFMNIINCNVHIYVESLVSPC